MRRFQHVSLFLYAICLTLTAYFFFIMQPAMPYTAVLLLIWSALSAYTLFWLSSRYHVLKALRTTSKRPKYTLPSDLIHGMHSKETYDLGIRALKSYDGYTAITAAMLCLYMFWGALLIFSGEKPDNLLALNADIQDFFLTRQKDKAQEAHLVTLSYHFVDGYLYTLLQLSIISLCLWIMRVLTMGSRLGKALPWLSFGLLLLMLMISMPHMNLVSYIHEHNYPWIGYGWQSHNVMHAQSAIPTDQLSQFQIRLYESGIAGTILFTLFIGINIAVVIKNFIRKSIPLVNAISAAIIVLLLCTIDSAITYTPFHFALYLTGWCAFAGLSSKSSMKSRKIYTIYQ